MELYQVTYTLPGQPTQVERGYTHAGAVDLMNAVLRAGGSGCHQSLTELAEIRANKRMERFMLAEASAKRWHALYGRAA